MAEKLSALELEQIPPRKYKIIRNELKTGDLIFCSGNYLFSKIIQKFTKSVWSHVGIIYIDKTLNRVLILESEIFYGVRLAPLSKYVKDYHGKNKPYKGKVVVTRIIPELADEQILNAISFGMDELTKPYDNWENFKIALRIIFKISRHEKNRLYLCSELVQACFKKINIEFNDSKKITTEVIWCDEKINFLYRLV